MSELRSDSYASQHGDLQSLLAEIRQKHLHPEDTLEVAALLESMGWNDARAQHHFGNADVFDLAEDLWALHPKEIAFSPAIKKRKITFAVTLLALFRQFIRGLTFALPMALSVLSMLILKFSLWSYQYFSVNMATLIAIGTILSFITVGGFTQAIARRGYLYIYQDHIGLARRFTFMSIRAGFAVSIIVSLALLIINSYTHFFPVNVIGIIVAYYFVLNSIWLSVTAMYILKKEVYFTGLIVLGIGIIYLLFKQWRFNLVFSQLVAMLIVSVLSAVLIYRLFRRAERKHEKGINLRLARKSVSLYSISPYFLYGLLYFLFLFTDRILAWSTDAPFMQYLIWFRGDYELGLDFALLTLILPMGLGEVIVSRFMADLEISQKQFQITMTATMVQRLKWNYWSKWLSMVIFAAANAVLVYRLVHGILAHYLTITLHISLDHISNFVFVLALIAYSLLALALTNAVVMFALSQPKRVLQSLAFALVVNIVVGFILSRWLGFGYAIFGLLGGSVVFAILTTYHAARALGNIDYYMYLMS